MNRNPSSLVAKPVTLLMTATINPPSGMMGSVRNDPDLRLKDYIDAFKFYLSIDDAIIDQIVILENSDSDLHVFTEIASEFKSKKAIHLVNTSSDYPAEKGKGYGEFWMLDQGIERIFSSGAISKTTQIWKVTGRLMVKNIDALVRSAPSDYTIYCDLRNAPLIGESLGGNQWMELRIFSFTYKGYMKYLRGKYDMGYVLEKELFSVMVNALPVQGNRMVPRFVDQPVISGFSGFSSKSYESPAYLTKLAIRQFSRRFFPGLWL